MSSQLRCQLLSNDRRSQYVPWISHSRYCASLQLWWNGYERVFTNLILNAAKHNPPQTKCLISVTQTGNDDDRPIRIIIADDGPKVPSQLRDRLFDSFAVGDESRNTCNGHGLGLAISKMIVERHGGTISYHDMWENGMKAFEIVLVWLSKAGRS